MRQARRLAVWGAGAAFLLSMQLPSAWAVTVTVDWPPGQEKMPSVGQAAPPPHAPAHGLRRKAAYRYYPDSQVYFDTARRLYFFKDGGSWQSSASLPGLIGAALGGFVDLEADHDRPYGEIDSHRAKYPPGQMKQKERGWEKHKDKGGKGHNK